ncbi:hypothetical protein AgCh_037874 [Apium graveolens]
MDHYGSTLAWVLLISSLRTVSLDCGVYNPIFVEDDEFVDNIEKNEEFINLDDVLVDVEDEDDNVEDENELENDYVEDEDDNVEDTNMFENVCGGGVPYMNQIFQSLDKAGHFFRAYALINGFAIKIQATHRNKENEIYGRLYVCRLSKKSVAAESSKNKRRREVLPNSECKVRITSRSEGMNSFFDNYVSSAMRLKEFIENAQKALERQFMREKEEDYVTINLKRSMKMDITLKYHASCIYTKKMFRRFQDELVESSK